MMEDKGLCTRFDFHKKKLVFQIEAMRNHADYLLKKGFQVLYVPLNTTSLSLEEVIEKAMEKEQVQILETFEIEDRFLRKRLQKTFKAMKIKHLIHPNPQFLHTIKEYKNVIGNMKNPHLRTFYIGERKKLNILMSGEKPEGGQYIYDQENRQPLPKNIEIPNRPQIKPTSHHEEVSRLVNSQFSKHPGSTQDCWLPTTRLQAMKWLKAFLQSFLPQFGPYQDALSTVDPFLFHSVLSPLLNAGLLTPEEVVEKALQEKNIPLNSLEGFIRQIIGWREFVRGIDECFGKKQESLNFFAHHRKFKSCWYNGTTGVLPLDDCISKVMHYGYCHHIERLMILSNLMLLSEIDPKEVFRWFMEMFIDSADWVMGPNVYGMGQFSDGGIFATKPYICGSHYLLKMSQYTKGHWCEVVDGLYWRFVDKHRKFFIKQPRLKMMTTFLDKMSSKRKYSLFSLAEDFIKRTTTT